uniref:basic salivary proline-rich protein 4-like n=1 Tax=Nyctereutes procyonoides TaxID=34880 RepID=UPI002443A650|nr:basic salivary proline-rich protein 4-like [Nyctereutes procyonoides]
MMPLGRLETLNSHIEKESPTGIHGKEGKSAQAGGEAGSPQGGEPELGLDPRLWGQGRAAGDSGRPALRAPAPARAAPSPRARPPGPGPFPGAEPLPPRAAAAAQPGHPSHPDGGRKPSGLRRAAAAGTKTGTLGGSPAPRREAEGPRAPRSPARAERAPPEAGTRRKPPARLRPEVGKARSSFSGSKEAAPGASPWGRLLV